jgi:DNA polymerase-3 subunit alpha
MILSDDLRVCFDDALLDALGEWLTPENVEIVYNG